MNDSIQELTLGKTLAVNDFSKTNLRQFALRTLAII